MSPDVATATATPTALLGDTLGGKFPTPAQGNNYAITWCVANHTPADPYITFGAAHSSAQTTIQFKKFVRDANIAVPLEPALNQDVTVGVDNGTEFRGEFKTFPDDIGIDTHLTTAHKKNTGYSGKIERAQRTVQSKMRTNLLLAGNNFTSIGIDPATQWGRAAAHGAYEARVATMIAALPDDMTTADRTAAFLKVKRMLPTSFGAVCTLTLQATSPKRKATTKQLAPRAITALYLGTDTSGRYIVMDTAGTIYHSIDVKFLPYNHTTRIAKPTPTTAGKPFDINAATTAAPATAATTTTTAGDYTTTTDDTNDDTAVPPAYKFDYQLGNQVNAKYGQKWYAGMIADNLYAAGGPADTDTVTVVFREPNGKLTSYDYARPDFQDNIVVTGVGDPPDIYESPPPPDSDTDTDTGGAVATDDADDDADSTTALLTQHHRVPHTWTLLATRATSKFVPHASVAQYINVHDQIKEGLLRGTTTLPPQPPLPPYTPDACPALPNTVHEALSGPDALYWLHAILKEYVGHISRPTYNLAPPHELREYDSHNGKWRGIKGTWTFTYKWQGDGNHIAKFSKKNKHFTLQERYVHQCVADDQIAVIKIDGNNFDADAMTKALPKQPFAGYYTSLHNGTA